MSESQSTRRSMPLCWVNGRTSGPDEALVSVFDHGFLYGDGVFEGLRFYSRRVFVLQEHLQRLADSAQAIALSLPYSLETLAELVQGLVDQCAEPDGYIRLIVTRGVGPMGLDPRGCSQPGLIILLDRLQLVSQDVKAKGLTLMTSSVRRPPLDALNPRIKSLNYLNNVLARIEASHAGADEAIMLNHEGAVAEGSAENIFVVRHGVLQTPPCTDGALEGITRRIVMNLARDNDIPVQEARLTQLDLYCADEVFLTGSGAELLPVALIDGRRIKTSPGPVYFRLDSLFRQFVRHHCSRD